MNLSEFDNLNGFISISNEVPESVHVSYIDPSSRNVIKVDSRYTKLVNSNVELGAVGHKLIQGSSGSAVTDINGDLVSMITSCGELYDNITLTIPVSTISKIVNHNIYENVTYQQKKKYLIGSNFFLMPDEVIFRSLSILIKQISQKEYPPRGKKMISLIEDLKNKKYVKATLGGTIVKKIHNSVIVTEEKTKKS